MVARIRKFLDDVADAFWLVPGLMVFLGVLGAIALVHVDREGLIPQWLVGDGWLYSGGPTGARTLLGAVASSTIAVAGTVFSITIAALSLAAGQMGPRLLRNFTRDRGNRFTLGAFLGTFVYALMVLRSVRTQSEGEFVPHLALSVAIALAFVCVVTLVWFVGHMAGRINVDTVIDLVSTDVRDAVRRLSGDGKRPQPLPSGFWSGAEPVFDSRSGYLQQLDPNALADWASEKKTTIRLLARPGDYVFPNGAIAVMKPPVEGADGAIRNATALGPLRGSSADLEYAIRQLVEVAVRALSPGVNDPLTAMTVLDRLGSSLCEVVPLHMPSDSHAREGRTVLVVPSVDYDGLLDAMFHMIRQNAAGKPAVLIRLLEVLTAVLGCERDLIRVQGLQRHADLVLEDAERSIANPSDLSDVRRRHDQFTAVRREGPSSLAT